MVSEDTVQVSILQHPLYSTPRSVKGYGINGTFAAAVSPFQYTSLTVLSLWQLLYQQLI